MVSKFPNNKSETDLVTRIRRLEDHVLSGANTTPIETTGEVGPFDRVETAALGGEIAGGGEIQSFVGNNLSIDPDGRLNAAGGGEGGGTIGTEAHTATASGDGETRTFALGHYLGEIPEAVSVDPTAKSASTDFWISELSDEYVQITYAEAPPTGDDNLSWRIITHTGDGQYTETDEAVRSGDGETDTFSLDHTLGSVPSAASVEPASADASTDFWISTFSDSSVSITYAKPPDAGTDNLEYTIITHE